MELLRLLTAQHALMSARLAVHRLEGAMAIATSSPFTPQVGVTAGREVGEEVGRNRGLRLVEGVGMRMFDCPNIYVSVVVCVNELKVESMLKQNVSTRTICLHTSYF